FQRGGDLGGGARAYGVDLPLWGAVVEQACGQSLDRVAEARPQLRRDVPGVVVSRMSVAAERDGLERLRPAAGARTFDRSSGRAEDGDCICPVQLITGDAPAASDPLG